MDQPAPDAYSLLSRPTLDLTDAEVEIVVEDLRRRRSLYLTTNKPEKVKKEAKVKADPLSKEAKAANTKAILGMLKLG